MYTIVEKEKELYDLSKVDVSSAGSDVVDHEERKSPNEKLIADDGLVLGGYKLVEEFSKVMMGLNNREPTKVPKKVKKQKAEKWKVVEKQKAVEILETDVGLKQDLARSKYIKMIKINLTFDKQQSGYVMM